MVEIEQDNKDMHAHAHFAGATSADDDKHVHVLPHSHVGDEHEQGPPKTPGEKFYDAFSFVTGKVFIVALTAGLAFAADQKHAPNEIAGVPNVIKKFQGWWSDAVMHNKIYPVAEKGDTAKLIGAGLVNTMVISHGGNLFAPLIKWMENSRAEISNWYNKKWGTPEDVEITKERYKDVPKQNWGDVIKGRSAAYGIVFASLVSAYSIIGKDKTSGRYWLDKYEDKFARMASGLMTKEGKAIAAVPMAKELSEIQKANKVYRFNKILALDLYATTAGILIWNAVSRMSAKKREEQEHGQEAVPTQESTEHKENEAQEPQAETHAPDTHKKEQRTEQPVETPTEKIVMHEAISNAKEMEREEHSPSNKSHKEIKPKAAVGSSTSDGYVDMVEHSASEADHGVGV